MDAAQVEEVVLQTGDHLHATQVEDHQPVDRLPAVLMEDHQAAEAVLQRIEAADHLHLAIADQKARHPKEEVVHQAADVDEKKVVLQADKFHLVPPT